MGFHTYDPDRADRLEDAASRYRYCSAEELLGALAGASEVVDLGSGTGFYTDDVAEHAAHVHAVDVQAEMHDRYREKGVPENVDLVTAEAADLPLPGDEVDAVVSTMTYHEFYSPAALTEIRRVLRPGGRLVLVDWSAAGSGASGPPTDERYGPDDVRAHVADTAFDLPRLDERPETWVAVATVPDA